MSLRTSDPVPSDLMPDVEQKYLRKNNLMSEYVKFFYITDTDGSVMFPSWLIETLSDRLDVSGFINDMQRNVFQTV